MGYDNRDKIHYLYWIRRKIHTDIYSQGYVGVSHCISKRFTQHKSLAKNRQQYHVHRAINKYKDIVYEIVSVGLHDDIYNLEYLLRPKEKTGWNISQGGRIAQGNKQAANKNSILSKHDIVRMMIQYYIKGKSFNTIADEYNIHPSTVSRNVQCKVKLHKDLEKYRQTLKDFHKTHILSTKKVSQETYDSIIEDRESGSEYKELSSKYKLSETYVQRLCRGELLYVKDFSSFRIAKPHKIHLTLKGKTQTVTEWADELEIDRNLIYSRLRANLPIEEILTPESFLNKSRKVLVTYKGKTQSIADWSRDVGINVGTLQRRIKVGWPINEALTLPPNLSNKYIRGKVNEKNSYYDRCSKEY